MTAPDATPPPDAPKKTARAAKAPAKKAKTQAAGSKAAAAKSAASKPAAAKASGSKAAAKRAPAKKASSRSAAKGVEATPATTARRAPAKPRAGAGDHVHDVVVIGAGPSGSSCAFWLADAGWDVVVVEKKVFPREKTCGDGLTPRAVRQLADMGLEGALSGSHRYTGLRAFGFGQSIEMQWPEHPHFPAYGYTITRHDLDGLVAARAAEAGATLLQGTEVVAVIRDDEAAPGSALPALAGVEVKEKGATSTRTIKARYVVVADGSNSRIGRMLGTTRRRDLPLGMALRGYYRSERHDDPFIESHLDIRDTEGNVVPGYGWIFPMGDGRVNVGVGLLSTEQRWKGVNTSTLMDTFVDYAPEVLGPQPRDEPGATDRRQAAHGALGGTAGRAQRRDRRRRRWRHQPLQRRGHCVRLRDRSPRRGRGGPRHDRRGITGAGRVRP